MGDAAPPINQAAIDEGRSFIYSRSVAGTRLRQGEIIGKLPQSRITVESLRLVARWNPESAEPRPELVVDFAEHDLVIIITQDCDLEQDYDARQTGSGKLADILFCDVHLADPFKQQLGKNMKERKVIAENQSPRYHFLSRVDAAQDALGQGLPHLAMDFKRHFSLPVEEVYERLSLGGTVRHCVLQTPYVEHLTQRFFSFQSRIALPLDHPTDAG